MRTRLDPQQLWSVVSAVAALGRGDPLPKPRSSSDAPPPRRAAAATAAASWLFVVTADAGVVTATGGDALTIALNGTAPRAVAFTDRPQRVAAAAKTPTLWAVLYANGSAPPNAALSFDHAGEAIVVPLKVLNVTGAAPNYTVAARVLGAGGFLYLAAEMVGDGAAVVRGPGDPLWAALQAGLAVDAPELFVDNDGAAIFNDPGAVGVTIPSLWSGCRAPTPCAAPYTAPGQSSGAATALPPPAALHEPWAVLPTALRCPCGSAP